MRKVMLAVFVVGISLFIYGCGGDSEPEPRRSSSRGRSADGPPSQTKPAAGPLAFQAPALDGRTVSVRGPAALFFFTTWCGYCKQVMPEVQRLAGMGQARGWRVYGVDVNETPDKAQWFVQNYQPNFPILLDQSGQIAAQYRVRGFPTFILIDASGKIIYDAHEPPRGF